MEHRRMNFVMTILAALALAMPIAARADDTKTIKPVSRVAVDLHSPATLAGKDLKPGTYQVSADESKMTISRDGKVIAEAPIEWKDGQSKASYTAVVTDSNQITEVHFGGKAKYISVTGGTVSGK
ncbi:MAG: hypothetical protein WB987_08685 [Candidatus Acidiferrales bacterium]